MLKLVKPSIDYKNQYIEMMKEWESTGEKIIPASIRKDYTNFTTMLKEFDNEINGIVPQGYVAATTLWAYDDETDKIVGAVNIRHTLNESLLKNGGHIGAGVRPSERRKGYSTKMIQLALNECRKLGITKVLMVCYKNNIGSAKSIQKNGGILENEIITDDGKIDQRYWIYLENNNSILENKKNINNNIKIRKMDATDFKEVNNLVKQVHLLHLQNRPDIYKNVDPMPQEEFNKLLNNTNSYNYVAILDGKIVGEFMAVLKDVKNHLILKDTRIFFIDDICINENYQGNGIGKMLYEKCISIANEINANSIELNVWSFNKSAISFYEHLDMKIKNIKYEQILTK